MRHAHCNATLATRTVALALSAALAGLLACGYPTARYASPTTKPATEHFVGLWSSQQCFGLQDRFEEPISAWPCSWMLSSDGTFTMAAMPEWSLIEEWSERRNSGQGTWSIRTDPNNHWVVRLQFENVNGMPYGVYRDLGISGTESPYSLFFFVGDADAGFIVAFDRRPAY